MRDGLNERARAKINLTLHVLGRRADGYHDLDSLVAFADVCDDLALEPGLPLGLAVTGPMAAAAGTGDDNSVLKAARLFAERWPGSRAGGFRLDKRLPVAAGIGGGSADAAAALRLLARLNDLPLDTPDLAAVAREVGADVPVCLAGRACVMRGVGDALGPVLDLGPMPAVLVNPRVPVETPAVFRALGLAPGESVRPARAEADPLTLLREGGNDLEAPAIRVAPVVADVLRALRAQPGVWLARMSGSGATCFALFADDGAAKRAAAAMAAAHPGWWTAATPLG